MGRNLSNPLLEAVNSVIGFPTIENLLCERKLVDFMELKEFLGDRLVIPNQKLCKSHVRRLADHILKCKEVFVPIAVTKNGDGYIVKDGIHRIAALEQLKSQDPTVEIKVKAKLI